MIVDENEKMMTEAVGDFVSGFSKIVGTSEVGETVKPWDDISPKNRQSKHHFCRVSAIQSGMTF